ncbi:helix-turn-helix domain-containing protein [Paenibacillus sp. GCM10023252]|uniref:AraC family transcriptional regulator n=1 Tax=Paenibacillus sp. GCM10023252 TaxID=3252649 RepID=UPI00360D8F5E
MRYPIEYEHEIAVQVHLWSPDTEAMPLHVHASLEIGCCLSGEGEFYFGSKQYPARQGDLFLVNHTEPHIARSSPNNPSTYLFLVFDAELLAAEDNKLLLPFSIPSERLTNRIPAETGLSIDIIPSMMLIWEELRLRREGYVVFVKGLLLQICARLQRYFSSDLSSEDWQMHMAEFTAFRKINHYMKERFSEQLELSDLAEALQLSRSRVSRLFQEVTGRSFKDYLQLLRVAEARRLLIRSDMQVTDVCFASGFQSLSSFYRIFTAVEGVTPTAYRNKYAVGAIFENES